MDEEIGQGVKKTKIYVKKGLTITVSPFLV